MHTCTQEHYVEYSRLGNVIKGQEKAVAKSRYEEDVYINNHTVRQYLHRTSIDCLLRVYGVLIGKMVTGAITVVIHLLRNRIVLDYQAN